MPATDRWGWILFQIMLGLDYLTLHNQARNHRYFLSQYMEPLLSPSMTSQPVCTTYYVISCSLKVLKTDPHKTRTPNNPKQPGNSSRALQPKRKV